MRFPVPHTHDEQSYVLAADTFASGRLTNPTHPLWERFETIHVIQRPTYMSKYPPAQGLVLALGQRLGHPVLGVWLGFGAFLACLSWALRQWLPARWAATGTVLALLRVGFAPDGLSLAGFGYWGTSYWGGAVAGAAGCVVLGALGRLRRAPERGTALAFAAGIAVLANSRPYEGLCLAIPAFGALALFTFRDRAGRAAWRGAWAAMGALLAAAAAWTLYYDYRVTGDPFVLPYRVYEAEYDVVPSFLLGGPRSTPVYRHEALRAFHETWALEYFRDLHEDGWLLNLVRHKLVFSARFFLGPVLMPLLLLVPFQLRSRKMRVPLALIAAVFAGTALTAWFEPHYAAPAVGALFLVVTRALRQLAAWRPLLRRALVPAVVAASIAVAAVPVARSLGWERRHWAEDRAEIARTLERAGGQHLVVVHYAPDHHLLNEWIANAADIDAAPVVWAREMKDPAKRALLLEHFRGRRLWYLEADADPPRLTPVVQTPLGGPG